MIRYEFEKVVEHDEYLPKPQDVPEGEIHYCHNYNVISFKCPCGCGEHIFINSKGYMPSATCWDIQLHGDKVTASPSIRMTGGCKSHYFIRVNKVHWCSDSPVLRKKKS